MYIIVVSVGKIYVNYIIAPRIPPAGCSARSASQPANSAVTACGKQCLPPASLLIRGAIISQKYIAIHLMHLYRLNMYLNIRFNPILCGN
jgi:hypothetical protein